MEFVDRLEDACRVQKIFHQQGKCPRRKTQRGNYKDKFSEVVEVASPCEKRREYRDEDINRTEIHLRRVDECLKQIREKADGNSRRVTAECRNKNRAACVEIHWQVENFRDCRASQIQNQAGNANEDNFFAEHLTASLTRIFSDYIICGRFFLRLVI